MAWSAIRNFAVCFALPLAAVNLKNLLGEENETVSSPSILKVSAVLIGIAFVLIMIKPVYFVSSNRGRVGIGLEEANSAALEFLRKEKIQGPIFHHFDVAAISSTTFIQGSEFLLTTGQSLSGGFTDVIFRCSLTRRNGRLSVATMDLMLLFLTIASDQFGASNLSSGACSILCGPRSTSTKTLLFWRREVD